MDGLFTHQLPALGQKHDMLCMISTDGQCTNLCQAIKTAHERDMPVLAITGGSGREIVALLRDDALRVLEAQQVTIHALCAQIDQLLLGGL